MRDQVNRQLKDLSLTQVNSVITITEACHCWQKAENTIRYNIDRGYLVARNTGSTWLISVASLRARWGPAKNPLPLNLNV